MENIDVDTTDAIFIAFVWKIIPMILAAVIGYLFLEWTGGIDLIRDVIEVTRELIHTI